jgi:dTDP-glucose 4,6-dehydratase
MKNILITGGAGFIGSNFIPYFAAEHPEYRIVNADKLTYAGNMDNLKEWGGTSEFGDVADARFVGRIFDQYKIDGVIHFAAESHVDNSIKNPRTCLDSNVVGTFTLLDAARNCWAGAKNRFHHISTDEVYGSLGETGLFTEETPYAPNSPYSASKASSDMFVRSYVHTFGLNATISNCSNNYGPKQHGEKLIPTIIGNCMSGRQIPIYGDGTNIRDWLYVMDHCRAVDMIFHHGASGETYNIGGRNERSNLQIAGSICDILDEMRPLANASYRDLITFVADRPGHDYRYAIDASKLEMHLGWRAKETFESGIRKTVEWYLERGK